jgi:uncharacterized iron-regulated protein
VIGAEFNRIQAVAALFEKCDEGVRAERGREYQESVGSESIQHMQNVQQRIVALLQQQPSIELQ